MSGKNQSQQNKGKKKGKQHTNPKQKPRTVAAKKPQKLIPEQVAAMKTIEEEPEELGNGAEPLPPNVNEDAGKDAAMYDELEQLEDEVADKQLEIDTEEPPFDPASILVKFLPKKEEE